MSFGPPAPLPNFLVIGAQRGGSTFLHNQLRAHPEVFMPPWEEGYFDDPFYAERDLEWLAGRFEGSEGFEARGLRDSHWIARPECPERIARELPGVRLLASLREPISRTVSTYFHYVGHGLAPLVPLNQGLRQLLDGAWTDEHPAAAHIVDYSRYGPQLERTLAHIDGDRLLVLINEDIRRDAEGVLEEAYRFIDVEPSFRPSSLGDETNQGTKRMGRLRVRRLAGRAVFTSTHESPSGFTVHDGFAARALVAGVGKFDDKVLSRFLPEKPQALDPDLRAELSRLFAPDIEAVEDHLSRRLDDWRAAAGG